MEKKKKKRKLRLHRKPNGKFNNGKKSLQETGLDKVYLRKIEPWLMKGCSISQACLQAGVPASSVYDIIKEDEIFAERIRAAEAHSLILAQDVVYGGLRDGDMWTAKWVLERKEPERYGQKIDMSFKQKREDEDKLTDEEIAEAKRIDKILKSQAL